jgi:hypothetical protein
VADTDLIVHAGTMRGKAVEDCPSSWLRWAAENWRERTDRDRELMKAVNAELEYRDRWNKHF